MSKTIISSTMPRGTLYDEIRKRLADLDQDNLVKVIEVIDQMIIEQPSCSTCKHLYEQGIGLRCIHPCDIGKHTGYERKAGDSN